jgi:hypothetical protein
MSSTAPVQSFLTHIRTLQLKKQSMHKDRIVDFVSISVTTIKANYFSEDYELEFENLKKNNELEYEKITKENGSFYFKFKALNEGPINFGLLKDQSQKLDNLARIVKANLRWVSLEQGIESTIYFEQFLTQKEKHLDSFFLVDNFSGRIHTPITSLQSKIRKHLLLKNEKVVSLDVAQIQPLLLSLILFENIGNNEFTTWIEQGEDIYLKFKEKLNLCTRDDAKKKFYEITFGKANKILAELFGQSNWIQWVNEVKSIVLTQNPNTIEKSHSNLAWLLQTTEVKIMRGIWQKLIDNDILFVTVHDEVIVRESDEAETRKIMINELQSYFSTFKVATKCCGTSHFDLDSLKCKVEKLKNTALYFTYELIERCDLSISELEFLVNNNILEETFTDCYRLQ